MTLQELIESHKGKLESCDNNGFHSVLLFSLQLPSICSRIEFPKTDENTGKSEDGKFYRKNGKVWDANIYKTWLREHINCFRNIFLTGMTVDAFCDSIYELRNQLTHEGIVVSAQNKYYFIEKGQTTMILGNTVFLPILQFCGDMFAAAEQTVINASNISISVFDDLIIPNETYKNICNDVNNLYHSFWKNYTVEDNLLNSVYDHVFFDNAYKEKEIETFFLDNPDCVYEIWDFGLDYCSMIPDGKIICEEYNEEKSKLSKRLHTNTFVCRLTRAQYERMKTVVKELNDFSEQHKFDIEKYMKGNKQQ